MLKCFTAPSCEWVGEKNPEPISSDLQGYSDHSVLKLGYNKRNKIKNSYAHVDKEFRTTYLGLEDELISVQGPITGDPGRCTIKKD